VYIDGLLHKSGQSCIVTQKRTLTYGKDISCGDSSRDWDWDCVWDWDWDWDDLEIALGKFNLHVEQGPEWKAFFDAIRINHLQTKAVAFYVACSICNQIGLCF